MKPKFFRKVLKNGMTIFLEKREVPVVSVAIAVKTGGIHEVEENKGISHFIEHLLYKGTPTRGPKQIAEEIENRGGELNGFTNEIVTVYWCKMPSEHLKIALDVLSDMVKNPKFDEKEIEKERKVIFEEIKMRRDDPRTFALDSIHEYLYEKPFGLHLIGTEKSMNSLTREKLVKRFKEIYQPNNLVLGVVGNANFEEIVSFAEKTFGSEKGKLPSFEIKKKNEIKIIKRKGLDQANLVFAYHSPLFNDKKAPAAILLSKIMAGGMASRLFSEIREKRNLAYAVKGDSAITKDYAYTIIYIGTTKENVEKVKKLILEEFEKVSKDLTEEELQKAKENVIGNEEVASEDSQEKLIDLMDWEIAAGNAEKSYKFVDEIKKVKLLEVKDLAKIKDYSFFALVPE